MKIKYIFARLCNVWINSIYYQKCWFIFQMFNKGKYNRNGNRRVVIYVKVDLFCVYDLVQCMLWMNKTHSFLFIEIRMIFLFSASTFEMWRESNQHISRRWTIIYGNLKHNRAAFHHYYRFSSIIWNTHGIICNEINNDNEPSVCELSYSFIY